MTDQEPDPLQPHSHDPNPAPPTFDPTMSLVFPDGRRQAITVAALQKLPVTAVPDCYIVSTGHGTSGPFKFSGTAVWELISHFYQERWSQLEMVSADGFGNRIGHHELDPAQTESVILLAYEIDGRPLTRQEGLIRLIVPSERDDALRQVKWVHEIRIRP